VTVTRLQDADPAGGADQADHADAADADHDEADRVDRFVRAFDHWNPELAADPHSVYRKLRQECPVAHSERHGGYWVLSRYADIEAAAKAHAIFSSTSISIPVEIGLGGLPLPPLDQDPPAHTRFRQMLLPFFSPLRTVQLEPFTRRVAAGLIEELAPRGRCDAADAFAKPLSIAVVAQILGVAADDRERFGRWISAIVETGATGPEEAARAGADIYAYFVDLLEARRQDPHDDLLTFLLHAEVDGEKPTDDERLGCAILLLIAGIDTTWSTLSASLWHLAQDPDSRHRILAHESAIGPAVEELLRVFAPTSVARITLSETTVNGQLIAARQPVLLPFPSANRDDEVFEDADRVVLDRTPNRHLAFGAGIHRCLGAHLARMELRVAFQEFLSRIPDFRLAEPEGVVWRAGPIRTPKTLDIVFG
jgi:cytochrome P450